MILWILILLVLGSQVPVPAPLEIQSQSSSGGNVGGSRVGAAQIKKLKSENSIFLQ